MIDVAASEIPGRAYAGAEEQWKRAVRLVAARRHFLPFVKWTKADYTAELAHQYVAAELEQFVQDVADKKSPRLMIRMPPQHGKSELVSRRLTPWVLGNHPGWRIVLASYGAELAEDMSEDARNIIRSDAYAEVFPGTKLNPASKAVSDWGLDGFAGGMKAVGVGGAITGRSAEILIIDDPVKGRIEVERESYRKEQQDWWPQGRDRVQKGGGIMVLYTPWHWDDLPNWLLQRGRDVPGASQWRVISLHALAHEDDVLGRPVGAPLAPSRFDLADLLAIKADIPLRDWASKYDLTPTPDDGDIFSREWFKVEQDTHAPGWCFQYWDTAHGKKNPKRKGDRSVCSTWRLEGNRYRLIDLWVGRPGYPELKSTARSLYERLRPRAVIVEDHSSGQSLIQDLRNDSRIPILPWKTGNESKEERAKAVSPTWQAGTAVLSIPQAQADELIAEHLMFPNGKFDDIVDSCSMALAHLEIWNNRKRRTMVQRDFRIVAA